MVGRGVLFRVFPGRVRRGGVLLLLLAEGRDESPGQLSLAPVLDIEIPNNAEGHGANKVDEQILHGIIQADIQVAVKAQVVAVDRHRVDTVYRDGGIAVSGIQHHGGDALNHRVLLHIQMKEPIHTKLEKFPQHTHGHGKAESSQSHIYGGELKLDAAVSVENINEGKAGGCAEKACSGVEHGVPVGVGDEITLQFTQYFCRKYEQKYDDFQGGRQLDTEVLLDEKR